MTIRVEVAATRDLGALEDLLHLYMEELSAIFPVEAGPDGRFRYERLPLYASEPEKRFAFLIRSGRDLAGFALVTRGSPATSDPEDLDVAEFFVLRSHRRAGVGRIAAFQLWNRLRASWVVRVSEANSAALPFWRETVRDYTRGVLSERRLPGSPSDWVVLAFDSADRSTIS